MLTHIRDKWLWVEVEGDGPPVLMVHGLGGTTTFFDSQARALRNTHRVIRFDLEGHGNSPLAGIPTIESWLQDIDAIFENLGVETADVVGHSVGAVIALHFAATRPNRAGKLALLGSIQDMTDSARAAVYARAESVRADGLSAIASVMAEEETGFATKARRPEVVGFVRELLLRQSDEGYACGCEAFAGSADVDLSAIRSPVLLVSGTEDPVSPPERVKLTAEAMDGARVQVIEGIGHWTAIEASQEVSASLADFLA